MDAIDKILEALDALPKYWWIAVNRDSVSMSNKAFRQHLFVCKPTPQLLIGVETEEESLLIGDFLLNAPEKTVHAFMRHRLPIMVTRQEAVTETFDTAEHPIREGTMWAEVSKVDLRTFICKQTGEMPEASEMAAERLQIVVDTLCKAARDAAFRELFEQRKFVGSNRVPIGNSAKRNFI